MAKPLIRRLQSNLSWARRLLEVALPWSMVATASLVSLSAQKLSPSGDAVIRSPEGGGGITIRTTSRLAGAIDSLVWNKKEFIDSHDHGRQLQSAIAVLCVRNRQKRAHETPVGSAHAVAV